VNHTPVRVAAVRRVAASADATDSDLVAAEEPLLIEIAHGPRDARRRTNAGVVLRTPGRDEDLAAGLLFAEGFVSGTADIESFASQGSGHLRVELAPGVELDDRLARRVLIRSSACGVCGRDTIDDLVRTGVAALAEGPSVSAALINGLPERLRGRQPAFDHTGGLHAAALFDASGSLVAAAEDIGRHNAVDKLIGAELRSRAGQAAPDRGAQAPVILFVSGRVAFEIVHKAVRARVPILAAVGAPSSLAVDTARAFNLTLVGLLREDRFNVYSGFGRIV